MGRLPAAGRESDRLGKKARELLYMGDFINAVDALRLGMINKVVPIDELRAATLIFAKRKT
jgi:enoyl-CoA hydratase/carnithine racemase